MQWLDKARLRLRSLFRRARVEGELDDELRFYVDSETTKHVAAGLSPADARLAAQRSLGNMTRVKEECRDARGLNALDELRHDVRYAARALGRSPGFTLAGTLIVALGIGANTAIFTVVNAVLFKPAPYDDPDRAAALPGVRGVAFTTRLPVQPGGSTTTVVEGYTPPTGTDSVELPLAVVSDDYFVTVGLRVMGGRVFGRQDTLGGLPVAVVNETAARQFWGDTNPEGRRLRPQASPDDWTQVVGVVEDSKVSSLDEPPTPMLYYPVRQSPTSGFIVVRTDGDAGALLPGLRAAIQAVSPDLPLSALGTLESRLAGSLAMPTNATGILGAFSLLAVLLASLGIYGVVSFAIARRSPEMGIRVALGAEPLQLINMVMREMLATVAVGLALLAAPALAPVLYQVPAVDTVSFAIGALLLVAVATLATFLPARRAAGVDPVVALRER